MQVPFTKMHGLGNDLMVLDLVSNKLELSAEQIRLLSDRHFGVGFDQLLLVEPPEDDGVDFNYRIFNADGEEVEHCGNGARCFAKFVTDKGLTNKNPILVKTVNRLLSLDLQTNGEVTVNMGTPETVPAEIPLLSEYANTYVREITVSGEQLTVEFSALSVGNPHAVIIVEDIAKAAVKEFGEALGHHPDFPQGVNVGFMQIVDRNNVKLRVYERGVQETLACGTGACAAVVAGCLQGLLGDTVLVELAGGQLTVCWQGQGSEILMTGPATTVYEGTIQL